MSDEGSWREYKREISRHISTHSTCVIFLGVFLSHAVRYDSYYELKRSSRLINPVSTCKKMSVCETFTVLEAVTVRNRLRRLSRLQRRCERESERRECTGVSRGESFEDEIEEESGTCILSNGDNDIEPNGIKLYYAILCVYV